MLLFHVSCILILGLCCLGIVGSATVDNCELSGSVYSCDVTVDFTIDPATSPNVTGLYPSVFFDPSGRVLLPVAPGNISVIFDNVLLSNYEFTTVYSQSALSGYDTDCDCAESACHSEATSASPPSQNFWCLAYNGFFSSYYLHGADVPYWYIYKPTTVGGESVSAFNITYKLGAYPVSSQSTTLGLEAPLLSFDVYSMPTTSSVEVPQNLVFADNPNGYSTPVSIGWYTFPDSFYTDYGAVLSYFNNAVVDWAVYWEVNYYTSGAAALTSPWCVAFRDWVYNAGCPGDPKTLIPIIDLAYTTIPLASYDSGYDVAQTPSSSDQDGIIISPTIISLTDSNPPSVFHGVVKFREIFYYGSGLFNIVGVENSCDGTYAVMTGHNFGQSGYCNFNITYLNGTKYVSQIMVAVGDNILLLPGKVKMVASASNFVVASNCPLLGSNNSYFYTNSSVTVLNTTSVSSQLVFFGIEVRNPAVVEIVVGLLVGIVVAMGVILLIIFKQNITSSICSGWRRVKSDVGIQLQSLI